MGTRYSVGCSAGLCVPSGAMMLCVLALLTLGGARGVLNSAGSGCGSPGGPAPQPLAHPSLPRVFLRGAGVPQVGHQPCASGLSPCHAVAVGGTEGWGTDPLSLAARHYITGGDEQHQDPNEEHVTPASPALSSIVARQGSSNDQEAGGVLNGSSAGASSQSVSGSVSSASSAVASPTAPDQEVEEGLNGSSASASSQSVSGSVSSASSAVASSTTPARNVRTQHVSGPITQLSSSELYVDELVTNREFSTENDMYSGHIVVGPQKTSTLFFWLVKAFNQIGKKKKLILWFNGGPGCSSMTGAMMEVSPFKFKHQSGEYYFEKNTANIAEYSSVLFIDHPPGVGLSILSGSDLYPVTYDQWIDMFVEFMAKFMNIFPEFKGSDIYFSGESFAGFYLPHLSRGLLNNIAKVPGLKVLDVKGIIVGNPRFDPVSQYKSRQKFLTDNEVLNESSLSFLAKYDDECKKALDKDSSSWDHMTAANEVCDAYEGHLRDRSREELGGEECLNVYDIRLHDRGCGMLWPPHVDKMPDYFSIPGVVKSLHIAVPETATKEFIECTSVHEALGSVFANSPPGIVVSSELLNNYEDFKIVIFEGDADYICNVYGVTEAVGRVRIGSAPEGLDKFDKYNWYIDSKKVGEYYKYGNLEYYIIYGGSHMPPVESPDQARGVFLRSIGTEDGVSGSSLVKQSEDGNDTDVIENGNDTDVIENGNDTDVIMTVLLVVFSVGLAGMLAYALMHKNKYKATPSSAKEAGYLINT